MARLKGRALKGPLGATHNTAIPQIDVANAPTCLACPLPECVYFFRSDAIRRPCPVWRKENERKVEYARRWRAGKNQARSGP